jgi:hypothetical protein
MIHTSTAGKLRLSLFALLVLAGTLLLAPACQKKNRDVKATATPAKTDAARLLSVANVQEKPEGLEVWFYETPLIHYVDQSNTELSVYRRLLIEAMNNDLPVQVSVAGTNKDRIAIVQPATAGQVEDFRAQRAARPEATETEAAGRQDDARLTGIIPNTTTLNTIFTTLTNQGCRAAGPVIYGQCIPFQYVADGCYARAHKMRQVIEDYYGYTSYKVFHYLNRCLSNPGSLAVSATLWGNNCCVKWWYHVAPYVDVSVNGVTQSYVLDPSMFTTPVSITTWANAQKNAACGSGTVSSKLAYYTSTAYAPQSFNYGTCVIRVFAETGYTSANSTCASYAPLQGCF